MFLLITSFDECLIVTKYGDSWGGFQVSTPFKIRMEIVMTQEQQIRRERVLGAANKLGTGVGSKLSDIWWYFLLRGIFAIALGIFALFWPSQNLSILVLAVGLYCAADGATGMIGSLRYPDLRENFVQALVLLGIGAVLIFWPGTSLRTLLVLFGAGALVVGISQVLTARRLPEGDPERGVVMTLGIAAMAGGLVVAIWPGSGVVIISWVIGIAAILLGVLLIFLGTRFKLLQTRVEAAVNKLPDER